MPATASLRPVSGAEAFEKLVSRLDYPLLIATTVSAGEPSGCVVGFATQSSIDPPRFLVCISDKNRTYRALQGSDAMAVHVVPRDGRPLVELFGAETGDDADKFAGCDWHEGPEGLPVIDGCPSWFAGRILERHRVGDHVAHLVEPFAAEVGEDDTGFFPFSGAKDLEPGHEA
jgi:flavin reductase (DIM6/NTAB) family NADH-FMN oxidoreductase RutF